MQGDPEVSEIMRTHLITSSPETPLGNAAIVMRLARLRAVPIVGSGRLLQGELPIAVCGEALAEAIERAKGDLDELRWELRRTLSRPLSRWVRPAVRVTVPSDRSSTARALLMSEGTPHLWVVEPTPAGRRLVGVVTRHDLLRYLTAQLSP